MVGVTHGFPEWIANDPGKSSRVIPFEQILDAVSRQEESVDIGERGTSVPCFSSGVADESQKQGTDVPRSPEDRTVSQRIDRNGLLLGSVAGSARKAFCLRPVAVIGVPIESVRVDPLARLRSFPYISIYLPVVSSSE